MEGKADGRRTRPAHLTCIEPWPSGIVAKIAQAHQISCRDCIKRARPLIPQLMGLNHGGWAVLTAKAGETGAVFEIAVYRKYGSRRVRNRWRRVER
jgi:hypothetical protein